MSVYMNNTICAVFKKKFVKGGFCGYVGICFLFFGLLSVVAQTFLFFHLRKK